MHQDLSELLRRTGVSFSDRNLLKEAFTHSSYVNEHRLGSKKNNERLEFLGDAVLELLVSEFLFHMFPHLPEGELTKIRAAMVCEPSLVKHAEELQLGRYVMLGKGEDLTGGRSRPALLADLFESFTGALYLDQGLAGAKQFLQRQMFSKMTLDGKLSMVDYKTKLQEFSQQHNIGVIDYRIVAERGPAHEREFVSEVYVDDEAFGQGSGRSKKESEQQAASQALERLGATNAK